MELHINLAKELMDTIQSEDNLEPYPFCAVNHLPHQLDRWPNQTSFGDFRFFSSHSFSDPVKDYRALLKLEDVWTLAFDGTSERLFRQELPWFLGYIGP